LDVSALTEILRESAVNTLPYFALFALYRAVVCAKRRGKGEKTNISREIAILIFAFYIICLYHITVFSRGVDFMFDIKGTPRVNLVPLVEIIRMYRYSTVWMFMYNFLGNVVWFVPAGVLLPVISDKTSKFFAVLGIGLLISLSIETLQFLLGTGVTDVDDVIINVFGTIAGWVLYKIAEAVICDIKGIKTRAGR